MRHRILLSSRRRPASLEDDVDEAGHMTNPTRVLAAFICVLWAGAVPAALLAQEQAPIIVVETSVGAFAFETFPEEAPLSVKHIVELVKARFYDGQRFHRAIPGFVVQWGDPRSRDLSQEPNWGRGKAAASGTPVGASEINKKRTHIRGAVALSHPGNPTLADSQLYVTLMNREDLNGKYTVLGHVISGMDVVDAVQKDDVIRRMYVRQ